MARRITGSSVSKGDLVRRKYTQLSLDLEKRDMHAERLDSGELGVVITTPPTATTLYFIAIFNAQRLAVFNIRPSWFNRR